MKNLNLAVIVSSAVLLVSGIVHAEDVYKKNVHNQNNFSKRPYVHPLPDSAYEKSNEFEGATFIRGELNEEEKALKNNSQMHRMNQLSKRPY